MIRLICVGLLVTLVAATWKDNGEVCFGARDNKFGKFILKQTGKFQGIELKHSAGFVSCVMLNTHNFPTRWGCGRRPKYISLVISSEQNGFLFPNTLDTKFHEGGKFQEIPGFTPNSSVVAFSNFVNPMRVVEGDEIRVWYGEDFFDSTESDNMGTSCAIVRTFVQ